MNWKLKAGIQRWISHLPKGLADPIYYAIQRRFGSLRNLDPFPTLEWAAELLDLYHKAGGQIENADIFEVGTGRRLLLPIAFWLCGARSIVTVDLNRYLRGELVMADLHRLRDEPHRLEELLPNLLPDRLEALFRVPDFNELMALLPVDYHAPADAREFTPEDLATRPNLHVSLNVLEHVPPAPLKGILEQGKALLRDEGIFVHSFDPSDHFQHSDPSISRINFLQFDPETWNDLAGNRFMFHNRLREDDYVRLMDEVGLTREIWQIEIDSEALATLDAGFELSEPFKDRPRETLATVRIRWAGRVAGHTN